MSNIPRTCPADDGLLRRFGRSLDPAQEPRHKLVGVYHEGPALLQFHTAGRPVFWVMSVANVVNNRRLLRGLSHDDLLSVMIRFASHQWSKGFDEACRALEPMVADLRAKLAQATTVEGKR